MKKVLFPISFLFLLLVFGCGSRKPSQEQKQKAEQYIQELINAEIGIYNGELTDANFLVLAVDAYSEANFDRYARTYLNEALSKGVEINGVLIVDIKNCQFGDGWVTGNRIGKAYK